MQTCTILEVFQSNLGSDAVGLIPAVKVIKLVYDGSLGVLKVWLRL
jgi:hypothetical protein